MPDHSSGNVTLPFSLFVKGKPGEELSHASITFTSPSNFYITNQEFVVTSGYLQKTNVAKPVVPEIAILPDSTRSVPVYSICALIIIIILRNLFYQTYQKYFISLINNYEIDFNIQKIGLTPLLMSLAFILFSLSDFARSVTFSMSADWDNLWTQARSSALVLIYPLAVTTVSLIFLNLSGKLFPILFSDIKALFGISFLLLLWNLLNFGMDVSSYISVHSYLIFIAVTFVLVRSILFFHVFRRSYRFRLPTTLFYICTLNLTTFLLLYRDM